MLLNIYQCSSARNCSCMLPWLVHIYCRSGAWIEDRHTILDGPLCKVFGMFLVMVNSLCVLPFSTHPTTSNMWCLLAFSAFHKGIGMWRGNVTCTGSQSYSVKKDSEFKVLSKLISLSCTKHLFWLISDITHLPKMEAVSLLSERQKLSLGHMQLMNASERQMASAHLKIAPFIPQCILPPLPLDYSKILAEHTSEASSVPRKRGNHAVCVVGGLEKRNIDTKQI